MKAEEKIQGPASYFPSIEKKYGQPVEHWFAILRGAGERKHMELVSLLKTHHGLGHGHANALVAYHLAGRWIPAAPLHAQGAPCGGRSVKGP